MKLSKVILIILVLVVVGLLSASCTSNDDSETVTEDLLLTIERGDLIIDVISSGNLIYSDKRELAFEKAGTVAKVLVEQGDSVEEGEVLAGLNTSEWEEQLDALEDMVIAAERNVTAKERAVTQAERQVTTKKRDLLQAEINLKNAEIALVNAQDSWLNTLSGGAEVKQARDYLAYAEDKLAQATTTPEQETWSVEVSYARKNLIAAETKISGLLVETEEVAVKRMTVEVSRGKLEDAQLAVGFAVEGVGDAEIALEDAGKALEDAGQALDETEAVSLEIKAPFAGYITQVTISVGDAVKEGRTVLVLADPTKFEADVLVNEIEIFRIREGDRVTVTVDAISDVSLPARVTHIAPIATIQTGVVNYKVTIALESLMPLPSVLPSDQSGQTRFRPDNITEALDEAVKEGRITQEQADIMKERMEQDGGFPQGQTGQFGGFFGQEGEGFSQEQREQFRQSFQERAGLEPRPGAVRPQALVLRQGLTVTVSILVEEKTDVLLVPNRAIIRRGSETLVRVAADGIVEERSIVTGISDWQYTEVTEGLSEGETVVVTQTTSTSTTPQRGGGMQFFGGGRR